MHLLSLPRHRIETTLSDYARIISSLAGRAHRLDAIQRFERAFAEYVGVSHAIAVSSGRLGIHLILENLTFSPGDEVIVPSFNLFAAIERFCQFGLVPKFSDIRRDDLNIDVDAAERLITPRTKFKNVTFIEGTMGYSQEHATFYVSRACERVACPGDHTGATHDPVDANLMEALRDLAERAPRLIDSYISGFLTNIPGGSKELHEYLAEPPSEETTHEIVRIGC